MGLVLGLTPRTKPRPRPCGNAYRVDLVAANVAIVLSERDYKLVTLFTKIAGIFTFASGTVVLVDHGRVALALFLVALGIVVTLAPVPMTVVKPESVDKADREAEAESFEVRE